MLITLQGHEIELLPDRAVYLPQHSALILSDVHLGKAAVFRAHGLAVPDGDNAKDLQRISKLLEKTGAKKIIIAGDLIHAPESRFPELDHWISSTSTEITLVIGNHDKPFLPKDFPIPSVTALSLGKIEIIHDPAHASPEQFSICGHIHPAIRIQDSPRSTLRSPCFHLTGNTFTLPAFGSFTGGQVIRPEPGDRVFIPINQRVTEVPDTCWSKRKR
ncbi:ligase-associated DNA damage response endonuclease PdeM [Akkermansiaceae bacterium]|nr:ligase-associated DNA damage response endonuclease PdeM [Akkermansiaceae bacterium]